MFTAASSSVSADANATPRTYSQLTPLTVPRPRLSAAGTNIQVFPDSSIPGNEQFAFLPSGQIWSNGSQMCVDMSLPPPPPPPPSEWTWIAGLLGGADALPPATMAIADAEAACMAAPLCYGISWSGPLNPATPQMFSFKTSTVPQGNTGNTLLRCGVQTPC